MPLKPCVTPVWSEIVFLISKLFFKRKNYVLSVFCCWWILVIFAVVPRGIVFRMFQT